MQVSRVSDIFFGICFAHEEPIPVVGRLLSGSGSVLTSGLPTCALGDIGITSCGHTGRVVTGSGNVLTNGRPTARMSDQIIGNVIGRIITGSNNVYVN